mgnify:CR=1 FL=1
MTVPAVCFAECGECNAATDTVTVTLRVDMRNQFLTGAVDTVSVAGSLQAAAGYPSDWTPGTTLLTDADNDSVYEVTLTLPADVYQYKFVNGTAWGLDESVPSACGVSNNRELAAMSDTILPIVCFGMCVECPTNIDTADVTFRVNMKNEFITAMVDSVSMAGDLQQPAGYPGNWSPGTTLLTDMDGDSIYEITLSLPEGTYQYKYLNGVAWGFDEAVPSACAVSNNRELVVSGTDPIVLDVVCFGTCDENCPVILPPVDVTFQVDMIDEIVNVAGIYVAGSFQNPAWIKDTLLMTDPDADGIYTWTESIRPGEYQYKYFNGDGGDPDGESSNFVTLGCGVDNGIGGTNRLLDITGLEMDTILPPYIYNACEVRITDAIDEIDLDAAYFIARPNPFNNMTTIAFNNRKGESFSFVLTNIAGQQ